MILHTKYTKRRPNESTARGSGGREHAGAAAVAAADDEVRELGLAGHLRCAPVVASLRNTAQLI